MGFALSQQRLAASTRGAPDYDLVEPVIRVAADGSVGRRKKFSLRRTVSVSPVSRISSGRSCASTRGAGQIRGWFA